MESFHDLRPLALCVVNSANVCHGCVQVDESQAKLVSDEERTTGGVQWATVEGYIMASGGWGVFSIIMATFGLAQLFQVAGTFWLQVRDCHRLL
jgi:hypothetical protein